MPDKLGDVAAAGGGKPAETGPGIGSAGPTGGGKAVPDDGVLTGGSFGDSLADGGMGGGLNSGDSLAEESGAAAAPQMSPDGPDHSPKNADAPTGGHGGTSSV